MRRPPTGKPLLPTFRGPLMSVDFKSRISSAICSMHPCSNNSQCLTANRNISSRNFSSRNISSPCKTQRQLFHYLVAASITVSISCAASSSAGKTNVYCDNFVEHQFQTRDALNISTTALLIRVVHFSPRFYNRFWAPCWLLACIIPGFCPTPCSCNSQQPTVIIAK
jgi:hypothetical protein